METTSFNGGMLYEREISHGRDTSHLASRSCRVEMRWCPFSRRHIPPLYLRQKPRDVPPQGLYLHITDMSFDYAALIAPSSIPCSTFVSATFVINPTFPLATTVRTKSTPLNTLDLPENKPPPNYESQQPMPHVFVADEAFAMNNS
uniref:Uncharacterized protein n=1 Tax=Timema genevievae TaxID=629358 RepID=A0A7R9K2K8_TIMGE|nr:unnamed protein product [Timema genevievae]